MPKDKKRAVDTSDSDSGPDDRAPVKKQGYIFSLLMFRGIYNIILTLEPKFS